MAYNYLSTASRYHIESRKHCLDFCFAFVPKVSMDQKALYEKNLPAALVAALAERGLTLSAAESMTGGGFAAAVTDVPGASAVLRSSYVTYAESEKTRMLGVSPETIKSCGVVSAKVAEEMAEGLYSLCGSDVCVSVTGFAGPEGNDVGLFFIGLRFRGRLISIKKRARRYGRGYIRRRAVIEMLSAVYEHCL